MATIFGVQTEYAYAIQDLGSLLEQVNVTPTTDVRDRAISAAVAYYTRRLPRVQVSLVSALASGFYPVPPDWIDVSRVVAIEFPLNIAPVPLYMSPRNIMLQPRESDALYIVPNPNPSGSFRLIYTAAHGATVALPSETLVGSIPAQHEATIGMISAARAMRDFADRMAGSVMSNVDSVNYRSKSKEFTDAAKALEDRADIELLRAELAFQKKTSEESYIRGWK